MTPTLSPEEVEARLHKVAGAAGIPNYVDVILIDASDTIADLRRELEHARERRSEAMEALLKKMQAELDIIYEGLAEDSNDGLGRAWNAIGRAQEVLNEMEERP